MRLQGFVKRFAEWLEPLDVIMRIDVSVIFLADKPERGARHNQIDRMVFDFLAK